MLREKECAQSVAADGARKGSSRTAAHSIAANVITATLMLFLILTAAGFVLDAWMALMRFFVVVCAGNPFGWSL